MKMADTQKTYEKVELTPEERKARKAEKAAAKKAPVKKAIAKKTTVRAPRARVGSDPITNSISPLAVARARRYSSP